jgi:RHS repeat-associated protein
MKYNGQDERVEARQGTTNRRFVYAQSGQQIGEYGTSATNVRAEHIWLDPDTSWEPLAYVAGTTVRYVDADHLATPVLMTSTTGAVQNSYTQFPFGQRSGTTSSPTTLLAFPGQLIDNTDRHYNMRRDYDPTLERYLQADPIGLGGGSNLYGYANLNPMRYVDPRGENPIAIAIAGCAESGICAGLAAGAVAAGAWAVATWDEMASANGGRSRSDKQIRSAGFCSINDDMSCFEHFLMCSQTRLADARGDFGQSRCGLCKQVCEREGGVWPKLAITGSGVAECDYWHPRFR